MSVGRAGRSIRFFCSLKRYNNVMNIATINPNIQGGTPCFAATRVPITALFDYLDRGHTIAEFLADFPTVSEPQVHALLEQACADMLTHAWQVPVA